MKKYKILVSACLLGHNVRFNGGSTRNSWVLNTLSKDFDLIPFCPEVGIGLPTPRPTLRLVQTNLGTRVVNKQGEDFTENMNQYFEKFKSQVTEEVVGVIFQKQSPSCGVGSAKIYNGIDGAPVKKTNGIVAGLFSQYFPHIPIIDSGRLNDDGLREKYLHSIYARLSFTQVISRQQLQEFHSRYKLLLMEHSPHLVSILGNKISKSDVEIDDIKTQYIDQLVVGLQKPSNLGKKLNVINKVIGILKPQLRDAERELLLTKLSQCKQGQVDIKEVKAILKYLMMTHDYKFLKKQAYLQPYPPEGA